MVNVTFFGTHFIIFADCFENNECCPEGQICGRDGETCTPTGMYIFNMHIVGEPEIQKLEKSGRKVAEF